VSIVKTINSPHWKGITYQVFDIPSSSEKPFEERVDELKELFGPGGTHACKEIAVVAQDCARDRQHVLDELKRIEGLGGEGLMLRKPDS
jgi:DNA ligase-1